jgi:hypothetical protein
MLLYLVQRTWAITPVCPWTRKKRRKGRSNPKMESWLQSLQKSTESIALSIPYIPIESKECKGPFFFCFFFWPLVLFYLLGNSSELSFVFSLSVLECVLILLSALVHD